MKETIYYFDVPLSIALLSDLHDHPADEVISSLDRNRPEIICVAGDLFQGFRPADNLSGHLACFINNIKELHLFE